MKDERVDNRAGRVGTSSDAGDFNCGIRGSAGAGGTGSGGGAIDCEPSTVLADGEGPGAWVGDHGCCDDPGRNPSSDAGSLTGVEGVGSVDVEAGVLMRNEKMEGSASLSEQDRVNADRP